MQRETLFGNGSNNWLSEADVDFFTGGGPGESGAGTAEAAGDQKEVQRRLLIGAALTAAVAAFALIPTEALDGSASKPVTFYLVPLLRSLALLEDLYAEVDEGNLESIGLVIDRVLNKPNEARKNLYTAVEFVEPSRRQAAREQIGNFVDLVQSADYNKYFDTVGGRKDGRVMGQYQDFSKRSIRAAVNEGKAILGYFTAQDVRTAREMLVQ